MIFGPSAFAAMAWPHSTTDAAVATLPISLALSRSSFVAAVKRHNPSLLACFRIARQVIPRDPVLRGGFVWFRRVVFVVDPLLRGMDRSSTPYHPTSSPSSFSSSCAFRLHCECAMAMMLHSPSYAPSLPPSLDTLYFNLTFSIYTCVYLFIIMISRSLHISNE